MQNIFLHKHFLNSSKDLHIEHCFENTISPKSFIVPINSLILFSSGLNSKLILEELGFITELIFLI